ncbi:MAG: hypothetical protein KDD50_12375 [Bdellovibrionales bacterium]|nr:hypothetical protein [Bdellovibrionales bacterium]
MNFLIMLLFSFQARAVEVADAPVPVFLKQGYSTILEFDETPTQVVIGDTRSFQVEKLKSSVVLKALVDESTSNMFVYFKKQPTRLFLLSVSDDAEPTFYRKFTSMKSIAVKMAKKNKKSKVYKRATWLTKKSFDSKKDFLSLEITMSADTTASIQPYWKNTFLTYKNIFIKPDQVWAEREVVQKDSEVKARFLFKRPNVPRTLVATQLRIPLKGFREPISLTLNKEVK